MSGKSTKTLGQAAQAQADAKPPVPGATPTSPEAAGQGAEDSDADDDADDDVDADEQADDSDDELVYGLRQRVRQLEADNADLQQQLTDERQRSGDAAGELNESEKLVEELQNRLRRADLLQAQSDAVIVSDGEHDYKVLAPKFKWEHKLYDATDLKGDEALVKRLVEAGVGFLHKIEAGE